MDVFTAKLNELRAKDTLAPMEQEALDTGDAEILVRLCVEKPVKRKRAAKK